MSAIFDAAENRLIEFLWTESGNPPTEYIELILCRDVYHCPPDVLDRQDAQRVLGHLRMFAIEKRVQNERNKKHKSSGRSRRKSFGK